MEDPQHKAQNQSSLKNMLAQFLLQNSINGKIRHGAKKEAEEAFGVSRQTMYRTWKLAKQQMIHGSPIVMNSKIRGYHHKDKYQLDIEKVKTLSVLERSSIRKMSLKLQVSKSLLGQWIKEKQLKPHTNAIKPALTHVNKIARLKWSLSQLGTEIVNGKLKYESMHNVVHIDEKWFYMTKCLDRYYLLPDEEEPYRSCKSKRFITKIMFMAAVTRPLLATDGHVIFDGKIGIFPFTTSEPAQRSSKNRTKGTMETKPIQAVTKAIIKDCIIQQIIPAIKANWPSTATKHILIQQDNVKPHIAHNDTEFIEAANTDGFTIKLVCQPANSPDTNVLDLGFFRAIQSIQDDKLAVTVDDLVNNVCTSFNELPVQTLNKVFITLQGCLTQIMTVSGGNNYKIPHMNKDRLIRNEELPDSLEVEEVLIKQCLSSYNSQKMMLAQHTTFKQFSGLLVTRNIDSVFTG